MDQCPLRPPVRINLPAGKFPEIGERLALGAPGDQHAVVGVDERGGDDEKQFHGEGPSCATVAGRYRAASRFTPRHVWQGGRPPERTARTARRVRRKAESAWRHVDVFIRGPG